MNIEHTEEDEASLLKRAFAAYFRGKSLHQSRPIPSNSSYVEECEGKFYVVLVNTNSVLAVYRVRPSGVLKGLKRWPKAIEPRTIEDIHSDSAELKMAQETAE